MSTGTRHDLLLLCAPGDSAVVRGLAKQLTAEGFPANVQTLAPQALAAAAATALDQAGWCCWRCPPHCRAP